ncbi:hypothetical protein 3 [Hubei myriapoda virus 7]|uniref:hypothetical protein 3 n=1 Tax=Hubei myriapoda virus 7 TaxID=1922936 RepID=UPI00090C4945|nr:hypothetical protein 3 [Hubei myriapoda virus 7]APG78792.1 hypothetical protein 3 [Hubei myriapoda virus 7]
MATSSIAETVPLSVHHPFSTDLRDLHKIGYQHGVIAINIKSRGVLESDSQWDYMKEVEDLIWPFVKGYDMSICTWMMVLERTFKTTYGPNYINDGRCVEQYVDFIGTCIVPLRVIGKTTIKVKNETKHGTYHLGRCGYMFVFGTIGVGDLASEEIGLLISERNAIEVVNFLNPTYEQKCIEERELIINNKEQTKKATKGIKDTLLAASAIVGDKLRGMVGRDSKSQQSRGLTEDEQTVTAFIGERTE